MRVEGQARLHLQVQRDAAQRAAAEASLERELQLQVHPWKMIFKNFFFWRQRLSLTQLERDAARTQEEVEASARRRAQDSFDFFARGLSTPPGFMVEVLGVRV